MPRGRRRKIEWPRDTQPQFELGDTAADIERRSREREERDERERIEQEERVRERGREMREESPERGEKRVRTDTDTDVESTQSRQKGQMKSIFLSVSDEEAIVEFVKQQEELYDNTNNSLKTSRWKTLGAACFYQKLANQDCEEVVRDSMYQTWQAYSDEVRASSGEEHRMSDLAEGQFQFSARSHQKGVSKSSAFKSPQRPSAAAASASVPDTSKDTESEVEISIASDVTHQPSSTSPNRRQLLVATTTTSADPVLDQFQQMRSMISTFLGARQDPTPSPWQSFCNYLHSEIEQLEERDFLTFRNETVKLLSEIQYKAEERKRQVTKSQEVTTYQLPEASQATAGHEYILTIQETEPVSIPVVQPTQTATGEPVTVIAKVQQPSRPSSLSAQPTSYVLVDDQQPGTSRQMIYNPPSVTASQQEESQHNTSGLSSLFAAIPSVLQYQQMDTPQPFSPSQLQPAPSLVPSSTHHE